MYLNNFVQVLEFKEYSGVICDYIKRLLLM